MQVLRKLSGCPYFTAITIIFSLSSVWERGAWAGFGLKIGFHSVVPVQWLDAVAIVPLPADPVPEPQGESGLWSIAGKGAANCDGLREALT
jgi:hypothetical protein